MAYILKRKRENDFFEYMKVFELSQKKISDEEKINNDKEIKNYLNSKKFKPVETIVCDDKTLFINGYINLYYIGYFLSRINYFENEILFNLKRIDEKYIALNYFIDLEKDINNLHKAFYEEKTPGTETFYFINFNRISFPKEMAHPHSLAVPKVAVYDLQPVIRFILIKIKKLLELVKIEYEKIKNIPEKVFEKRWTVAVFALYFHYMFKAKELESFNEIAERKKIKIEKAMELAHIKEGFEYKSSFYNIYLKISSENSSDEKNPVTLKNLHTLVNNLNNRKVIKLIKEEIEGLL